MIDTKILEEQITRMEQVIEQRANQVNLLTLQQKEEVKMVKKLKEGLENLKKLQ